MRLTLRSTVGILLIGNNEKYMMIEVLTVGMGAPGTGYDSSSFHGGKHFPLPLPPHGPIHMHLLSFLISLCLYVDNHQSRPIDGTRQFSCCSQSRPFLCANFCHFIFIYIFLRSSTVEKKNRGSPSFDDARRLWRTASLWAST